jgi:hypothetical protein
MSIRCIVIKVNSDYDAFCDGVVHEFDTEKEYRAFADGVQEVAGKEGLKYRVFTKDAYGKLPLAGNEYVKQYLIEPLKGVDDKEGK